MANTSKRGFASMDASKQREIASKGGRAAHAKGTAHEFTSDEARVAGRKGGEAVSRDRQHMSNIGREGGHSRGARARAAAQSPGAPSSGANLGQPRSNEQTFERQANTERSGFERSTGDINRPISNNSERPMERDRGSFAAQDRNANSSRNDQQSDSNPFSGRGNS